jgi:hypothetical protein
MVQKKRVKRPVLERTEPDRAWNGVFGGKAAPTPREHQAAPKQAPAVNGDVRNTSYEAVNGAYRVIDEYLRHGQRLAEQVWLPQSGGGTAVDAFGQLFERFVRSAGDMGTAWLEMMNQRTASAGGDAPRGIAGPFAAGKSYPADGQNGRPVASPSRPTGLSISVTSSRECVVSVDLLDGAELRDLHVSELASEDGASPIRGIQVEGLGPSALKVRVVVPDGQAAGVYNGILVERTTRRPRGTVSLSLA